MTFIRVIDLETGGNGPRDVCEIGWQDVELRTDGRWHVNDSRGALLVNPGRPISPETMAVHHILDRQVADAPFWGDVARGVLRPAESCWLWPDIAPHLSSVIAHHD